MANHLKGNRILAGGAYDLQLFYTYILDSMKSMMKVLPLLIVIAICSGEVAGQDSLGLISETNSISKKFFESVSNKADDIDTKLTKQTERYLRQLAKTEQKLSKQLARKDSLAASRIFGEAKKQYEELRTKMSSTSAQAKTLTHKYLPQLDTLKTAFSFLANTEGITKKLPDPGGKLQQAMNSVNGLQQKFNQVEEVKLFVRQRQQLLQEQLTKFGMLNKLKKYQRQAYYYQAQMEQYKQLLRDPSKVESAVLNVLRNMHEFKDFFAKHSQLASMFRLPSSSTGGTQVAMPGLQTRESVQEGMIQQFGSIPQIQQVMHQQLQGAKEQLSILKEKINEIGGNSNTDVEMPDFKPNSQKTRSWKQRLEFGSNLQTVKSNKFFPSTTDIGLSLGYKLNDKSVIGLGGSYRAGWGKDIRHIAITHQGVSIRSFVDYKIKESIWLSGGAELNYRSQFRSFKILDDFSAWQKSALVGISKKYQVSKKIKGNAQLLYDAMWKQQTPRTQPVVFRLGYSFTKGKD